MLGCGGVSGIKSCSSDDFFEWSISFTEKPFPDPCGIAKELSHQSIAGVPSIVGRWVNPRAPGVDACAQATKLMELTRKKNP
jgi:hypothetical protein